MASTRKAASSEAPGRPTADHAGSDGVSPSGYRKVVLAAGALLTLIIFTGALVRLTESGLGCEDWPTCSEEKIAPEWGFHPWIEFGNRLLSGVVGLGVIAAVLTAYRRNPRRDDLVRWAWFLVAGVAAQVLLGGVTVRLDLHPLLVSSHFLLSMVLLWNAMVLLAKARGGAGRPTSILPIGLHRHSLVAVISASALLVTGTLVTGTGPNSGDFRADRLNFSLSDVARVHGLAAWITLALLVALAVRMRRAGIAPTALQTPIVIAVLQGALGYTQYELGVPPTLVMLHVIGAVAFFLVMLRMHLGWFERPTEVPVDHTMRPEDLVHG
jgi:cytochrome c oxidase assembly protein subunit 15